MRHNSTVTSSSGNSFRSDPGTGPRSLCTQALAVRTSEDCHQAFLTRASNCVNIEGSGYLYATLMAYTVFKSFSVEASQSR